MATIIVKRRWKLLGHVLRQLSSGHQRENGGGRPKVTWRWIVEAEIKEQRKSWGTLQKLAHDRQGWRTLVTALYTKGVEGSHSKLRKYYNY